MSQNREEMVLELQELTKELEAMGNEFNSDGIIDTEEQELLNVMMQEIESLKGEIGELGAIVQSDANYTSETNSTFEEDVCEETTEEDNEIEEANYSNVGAGLRGSVGDGGDNNGADVQLVISWLNNWGYRVGTVDIDSPAGLNTLIEKIIEFQQAEINIAGDGRIDKEGTTWSVLSRTPGTKPIDVSSLGVAEDETEEQLLQFQEKFTYIEVRINSEDSVDVTPPYVNGNSDEFKEDIKDARERNPDVAAHISGNNLLNAKSTPTGIKHFLEACIANGLVQKDGFELTSEGLRDFLAKYGVGTDCNGLAFQGLNYLEDGNLGFEEGLVIRGEDNEVIDYIPTGDDDRMHISHANGLYSHQGGFEEELYEVITSPSNLKAGDLMYLHTSEGVHRHVRIITDVDMVDGKVIFLTVESGSDDTIIDAEIQGIGSGGVGDMMWRYDNPSSLSDLLQSINNGNSWRSNTKDHKYYRRK